jgi:hypothetical protein
MKTLAIAIVALLALYAIPTLITFWALVIGDRSRD